MHQKRPSDTNTFLLPKTEREIAIANSVLGELGVPAKALSVTEAWPDCQVDHKNNITGLELTQPDLHRQRFDLGRKFDEISFASHKIYGPLGSEDSRIDVVILAENSPQKRLSKE